MIDSKNVESTYNLAKERYAALGVDTEKALAQLETISISLHCLQADDVGGFENPGGDLTGVTKAIRGRWRFLQPLGVAGGTRIYAVQRGLGLLLCKEKCPCWNRLYERYQRLWEEGISQ